MRIRPAQAEDIPQMAALAAEADTAAHWPVSAYNAIFTDAPPRRVSYVVDLEPDETCGSVPGTPGAQVPHSVGAFIVALAEGCEWEIENVVVSTSAQRRGYALKLVQTLANRARELRANSIFLEVRESNIAARALYAKAGFKENGRRKNYYCNPEEDAVLLGLFFA